MAINENIETGKHYRVWDNTIGKWIRKSFWTKASDVEFDDGKTAEQKIGGINGIENNLTSSAADKALSAAQGKELKTLIDNMASATHDHDDRYYTESEVNNLLGGKSGTGHTHDDRYYTESEVNSLLGAKAGTGTASQSANGLMSASDKQKLDSIAWSANNYTYSLPTASQSTKGGIKIYNSGTTLYINT